MFWVVCGRTAVVAAVAYGDPLPPRPDHLLRNFRRTFANVMLKPTERNFADEFARIQTSSAPVCSFQIVSFRPVFQKMFLHVLFPSGCRQLWLPGLVLHHSLDQFIPRLHGGTAIVNVSEAALFRSRRR